MHLEDFPGLIAHAQESLLQSEQSARDWEMSYLGSVNEIDLSIAFDADLKNEQQRKATRIELLGQPHIAAAFDTLCHLQDQVKRDRIALELLQNQFTVAKIQRTMPESK